MAVGTSVEMIESIQLPGLPQPLDFNGDQLEIGNHVMFARGRGELAEGLVVGLTRGAMVTLESLHTPGRCITMSADGCIKIVNG
jgi:hypothetical protein